MTGGLLRIFVYYILLKIFSKILFQTSIERRKMSKRLTEEAMAYFDECVSISTFDSSDFSSPEDPPLNLVGATTLVGDSGSLPQGSPDVSTSYCHSSCLNPKQVHLLICWCLFWSLIFWTTKPRHITGRNV